MRERHSKKRKIVSLPERTVGKGAAGPPESNMEIGPAVVNSLRPGAVVGADGGQAIASQVKLAAVVHGGSSESIPVASAIHGRQPRKQFTCCVKYAKSTVPEPLREVLLQQGRWDDQSGTIKFVGGNQAAEGEWGSSASLLHQKAAHRGQAKLHSTAHAASALFLYRCPGLRNLGLVMARFYDVCLDQANPSEYFSRSGWTSAGAPVDDLDAQRVCATAKAAAIDSTMDAEIARLSKKKRKKNTKDSIRRKPASAARVAKRPAARRPA